MKTHKPIGHPDEKSFYFFKGPFKRLFIANYTCFMLISQKAKKDDVSEKDEVPNFIEKKSNRLIHLFNC